MATTQELDSLESLRGTALDDTFLRLMIAHHAGGVAMADAAVKRVEDEEVRALALRMQAGQQSEITEMQQARARLGLPAAPTDVAMHHTG